MFVDLSKYGAKVPCGFSLESVQCITGVGGNLGVVFNDGVEDNFEMKPNGVLAVIALWKEVTGVHQLHATIKVGDLHVVMRRTSIASVRYFLKGHEDSPFGKQAVIRLWFNNGELFLRHDSCSDEVLLAQCVEFVSVINAIL